MNRLTYTDEELAEFENMDCPVKANDLVNRFCDLSKGTHITYDKDKKWCIEKE